MFTENEFELLLLLKKNPFLNCGDFESNDGFDNACEMIKEMFDKKYITSSSTEPFVKSNIAVMGFGPKYNPVGEFSLLTIASDAVKFENYKASKKSCSTGAKWSLENRLKILSLFVCLLVSLLAIFVVVYIYHFPG